MNDFKDVSIIDAIREAEEMRRGLGDILLTITEKRKGNAHRSIKNENELVNTILCLLNENTQKDA